MKKELTIQATGATNVEDDPELGVETTSVEVEAFRTLSGEPDATWSVVFYTKDGAERVDVVSGGRAPTKRERARIVEAATVELRREG